MKIILMTLTLLGIASPVFADTLPCQEEAVQFNRVFDEMGGDAESQSLAKAGEDLLFACMDDYESKYGKQARVDLSEKLSHVV